MKKNWDFLCRFLPKGWTLKANELGAFERSRGIKSSKKLLRLLLIHIAHGYSMRETVVIAKQSNICNISNVALHKRLSSSGEWFRWLTIELLKRRGFELKLPTWLKNYRVISVDGSVISEPGSTGTDWRLHYSFILNELRCNEFKITRPNVGEGFLNFKIEKKDLLIGDRAYGTLKGLKYIKENSGDFIVRLKSNPFQMFKDEKKIDILEYLSTLDIGQIGEWDIIGKNKDGLELPLRICAIRKSDQNAAYTLKKVKQEASKKHRHLSSATIEHCKYIVIATSLPSKIRKDLILELYRYRWQIEIAFKRLKSILGLGHLPKKDLESCRSWLYGKMFVALLAETMVVEGRLFSPWGYPLK